LASVVLIGAAMKLHLGTNVFVARLRYSARFQSWLVAVGPVLISREGLLAQNATLHADNPVEERQLAASGLVTAVAVAKAA
jgi:hypothetical protein